MKKIILLIMGALIFIISCAQNQPQTEEEREK
jgi:PBP1b-binding outer membrane lipoprotein LpoB